jgi:nitroimidazol reductase NimA-like FMN-containing flavoprotein (pyridoxamine 5'-phosphate oxidase superfamily)
MRGPLPRQAAEILAAHSTCSLATASGDRPWASVVYFAEEGDEDRLQIWFATLKPSRKWRHLTSNPAAAIAVGSGRPDRWLQARGAAQEIDDPAEITKADALIARKAPEYRGFVNAVREVAFFRLVIEELRVVDLTRVPPRTVWLGR